jgi:hypothetical protein
MSDAKSHHANSRLRLRLHCFKSTGEEHPDEQRLREKWQVYRNVGDSVRKSIEGMTVTSTLELIVRGHLSVPCVGELLDDLSFAEDAAYFMRYAAAAYGWRVINGCFYDDHLKAHTKTLGIPMVDDVNKHGLLEHIPTIEESDVLFCRWKADLYAPSWFIARDRRRKALLVVIRGTLSKADSLVDLMAHPVPFSFDDVDGYAHEGMLQSARRVKEEMEPVVLGALAETPDYPVVIVGHSLGAGVAVLLTFLARTSNRIQPPMCFAFAVPTVVCEALCEKARECNVHSFVLSADIVPRLSIRSLDAFLRGFANASADTNKDSPLMLPPGQVYSVWSSSHQVADCRLYRARPQDFDHILSSKRKFKDHLPHNYERAMLAVAANLRQETPIHVNWSDESMLPDQSFLNPSGPP